MSLEQVNRICDEMNSETKTFLTKFSSKLGGIFSGETSDNHLGRMVGHLRQFYDDVFNELEDRRASIIQTIDDLRKEFDDIERALNTEFDYHPGDGLPLTVLRDNLDEQLVSMRKAYKEKRDIIDGCLLEQEPLVTELGEEMRVLSLEPLASDAEVAEFKEYLRDLKEERVNRLDKIDQLQNNIRIISTQIELSLNDTLQKSLSPTKANIQRLENELEYLQKKRDSLRADCDQLLGKLTVLWECLECPQYLQQEYTKTAAQCTQTAIDILIEELKRCKIMKQANMKKFIDNIRTQIEAMWDKCYKSDKERAKFAMMHSDAYTDDLLTLHELELEECKRFYADNEEIFELFKERNAWWERKKALDAKQNDPNRYNNRGGQLLQEEKERKLADVKIPKIEKRIAALAEAYNEKTKRQFTINGDSLVDLMERDWDNYRGSKEILKSARKAVATPSHMAKTPRTPMSSHAHMSMKRIASTTSLAMSTGNMAKRRHLEVPSVAANITSSRKKTNISSVYAVKPNTKRNLLSQLNEQSQVFALPQSKRIISHVKTPTKPNKSLAAAAAKKVVQKYGRRSSKLFVPRVSSTDDSLVNYDMFENHALQMANSSMANSSIIGQQENMYGIGRTLDKPATAIKTPIKANLTGRSIPKSPLKATNFTQIKTTKVIDI